MWSASVKCPLYLSSESKAILWSSTGPFERVSCYVLQYIIGIMSEAIATFQSQLSGVMETVFKAAMYEITRLVEDSFLEEVTRCREQVESLKRRLKWSESRRKEREADRKGKCLDCGKVAVSTEGKPRETPTGESVWSSPHVIHQPITNYYDLTP